MGFSGRLEGIAPSDIFQIIGQSRMTGTLIARCRDGTAMVVFKNGQVIEAASDAPLESLGHLLVIKGLMTEETIEAAQNRRKLEPDRTLGAILLDMGVITERTLETVVLRQIGHIVHRLVACEDGFFTFDAGEMALKRKLNTREFFLPSGISAEYLLMERARALDEERRSGSDRRARATSPPVESEPARESSRPSGGQLRSGAAAVMNRIASWYRRMRRQKAVDVVIRTWKEISLAAGERINRSIMPWLRSALNRIRAFSPDGHVLIFTAIGIIVTGSALMVLTLFLSWTSVNDLVVTGRVVNLRAKPTIATKVVAKVERGDTVTYLATEKGWHNVRTEKGDSGWIWQNLVEQKEKRGLSGSCGIMGSGLLIISGVAFLIMGVVRKRRSTAVDSPH